ncbi:MAG: hypothetical protein JST00_26950 [Deltaproteobacteria bacterium]|nr:hypothetical protein [Deltaproteobacteria bacterium]
MNKTSRLVVGWASVGSVLLLACSAGSGTTPTGLLGWENAKGDYQKPGEDGQDPPPGTAAASSGDAGSSGQQSSSGTSGTTTSGGTSGTTTSGGTSGTSGTSGGTSGTSGSSGTPSNCHPCDGTYVCQVTGSSSQVSLSLSKQPNGDCQVAGSTPAILTCQGTVTQGGQNAGTWTRTSSVTQVKLGSTTFTCVKSTGPDAG